MLKKAGFFFCGVLVFLSACSQKKEDLPKDSLRINLITDPSSLCPQKVRNLQSIFTARLLYEGLMRLGSDGSPQLALADELAVSENKEVYTFSIKSSNWSNGEKVRSSDFAYAWQKALDPSFPCDYAEHFFAIKNAQKIKRGELPIEDLGLRILDETHLEITLEKPTPYFLELLTFPTFYPICEKADRADSSFLVTNGPYLLKNWQPNDHMEFCKNNTFWDAEHTQLKTINACMVSVDTELKLFENKELDWLGSPISTVSLEALSTQKGVNKQGFLGTYYLAFNTKNEHLAHLKLRKALALCLNQQTITEHALYGSQTPTTRFVPESLYKGSEKTNFAQGSTSEAQSLFQEYLQETSQTVDSFTLSYLFCNSDEKSRVVAQCLQEEWHKHLGIHVKLQMLESKAYFARLGAKDFDIAARSWIADFADPTNFLDNFASTKSRVNATGWENTRYNELLEMASHERDEKMRLIYLKDAENILLQDCPIAPVFHYNMLYLKRPDLKNVSLNSQGHLDVVHAFFENKVGEK